MEEKRFTPFENNIEVKKEGKIKKFFKKKPVWITLIVVGALGIAAAVYFIFFHDCGDDYTANQPPKIEKFYSQLTGVETSKERSTRPILAVIIENSPEARPQAGLYGAGVVFEAVAEGGITRFTALYQEAELSSIGPVRSVRPYFIEWANPFDVAFAHAGGSPQALQMIRSGNYGIDIDEFFLPNVLWRSNDRWAPHNVFTSTEALLNYVVKEKGKTGSRFTPWLRKDGKAPKATVDEETGKKIPPKTVDKITIPVSTGLFGVTYEYNIKANKYLRFQGGQAHLDENGSQIAPKVVIAMMVSQSLNVDGVHTNITTTGSGIAYIFQNGTAKQVTWERGSISDMLIFRDSNGAEMKLNSGQTWITAVPNGNIVSWQ